MILGGCKLRRKKNYRIFININRDSNKNEEFFSVSNIHVWSENMGSIVTVIPQGSASSFSSHHVFLLEQAIARNGRLELTSYEFAACLLKAGLSLQQRAIAISSTFGKRTKTLG